LVLICIPIVMSSLIGIEPAHPWSGVHTQLSAGSHLT
jgi:hypothetical protein